MDSRSFCRNVLLDTLRVERSRLAGRGGTSDSAGRSSRSAKVALAVAALLVASAGCGQAPAPSAPAATETVKQQAIIAPPPLQVLFVVGVASPLSAGDSALDNRLRSTPGHSVETASAASVSAANATGKQLVIVSGSAAASDVGEKFKDVPVPVMVLNPLVLPAMSMTGSGSSDFGTQSGQTSIAISSATAPMRAGYTGTVQVTTSAQSFGWGSPTAAGQKVANVPGNSNRLTIFGYSTGAAMSGLAAPAPRVGWFASPAAVVAFRPEGWALFDAAVKWATNELVMVVNSSTLTTGETALRNRLQGPLGLGVRPLTPAAATVAAVSSAKLILISDTMAASSLAAGLTTLAVPIVTFQQAVTGTTASNFVRLNLTGSTLNTHFGTTGSQTQLTIAAPGHLLAGGLTGQVTVSTSQTFRWAASLGSGAVRAATIVGNSSRAALFGYPRGGAMATGNAPARRVGLWAPTTAFGGSAPGANAWTLFEAAVNWARTPEYDSECEGAANGTACGANTCMSGKTCQNQICTGGTPTTGNSCGAACNPGVCSAGECTVANVGSGSCCTARPAGLVSLWSGEGNPGDAVGAWHGTNAVGTPYAAGKFGQGFQLGSEAYRSTFTGPALPRQSTLEFWYKPSVSMPNVNGQSIFASPSNRALGFLNISGNLEIYPGPGLPRAYSQRTTWSAGTWYHVAITFSGTEYRIYVNGALDSATANTHPLLEGVTSLTIADGPGVLDEFAIYSRVLSGSEVLARYQAESRTCMTNPCTAQPSGASCSDGNACNGSETCRTGRCTAGAPVVCAAPGQCRQAGECNPLTGTCTYPLAAAGAQCEDGSLCTTGDTCQASGVCASGPVTNSAPSCSSNAHVGALTVCASDANCPAESRCENNVCETRKVDGIWEHMPNAGAPDGRIFPMGGFDPILRTPLVWGGYGGPGHSVSIDDLFIIPNGTWQLLVPNSSKPPGGCCGGMTFDSARNLWWLWAAGGSYEPMWSFSPSTRVWERMAPQASGPPGTVYEPITFDTGRARVVLVAGWGVGEHTVHTWDWDGAQWQRSAEGPEPPWRFETALGYHEARGQVVMFGGRGRSGPHIPYWEAMDYLRETWIGTATPDNRLVWTLATPQQSPPASARGTLVYDSKRERLILAGGFTASGITPNETWEWDGDDWILAGAGPGDIYSNKHVLAYDPDRNRTTSYLYNTTSEYYTRGNSCRGNGDCGNGNCVDGVCCATSTCGAGLACNLATSPGICAEIPQCSGRPNGFACDDGNPCTSGDHCTSGTCTAGSPRVCDDGNPCTADVCDPLTAQGCVSAADPTMENVFCGGDDCEGKICQGTECVASTQPDPLCSSAVVTVEDGIDESDQQQVLSSAVVPAGTAGATIVGKTPGQHGVTDTGEATYSIPLLVAPGRAGIEPALSLEYRSRGGSDLLGPRWSLSGLSTIVRCRPTRSRDGTPLEVQFNGQTYCLDGERLVGVPGGYRTERNPFSKIEITATDTLGPVTFKVSHKDGRIAWYGRTEASRAEGPQRHQATSPTGPGSISYSRVRYAWMLDKVEDRSSQPNWLEVTYCCTTPTTATQMEEPRPLRITYTGSGTMLAPSRSVEFGYVDVGPEVRQVAGLAIRREKLISTISMTAPGVSTFRQYRLTYSPVSGTGRQLLTRLKECDGPSESAVCSAPTEFSWESKPPFDEIPLPITDATPDIPYLLTTADDHFYHRIIAADLNGDGRDDILYRGFREGQEVPADQRCLGWISRLSTGTGFGPRQYHAFSAHSHDLCDETAGFVSPENSGDELQSLIVELPPYADIIPVDIDRDGRDDIIVPYGAHGSYTENYYLYFNNTAQTSWTSDRDNFGGIFLDSTGALQGNSGILLADVTNDGNIDILRPRAADNGASWGALSPTRGGPGTLVRLSGLPPLSEAQPIHAFDVDAVGRSEIMVPTADNLAFDMAHDPFIGVGKPVGIPRTSSGTKSFYVDLNGDGLRDVAWVESSQLNRIHVRLNAGNRGFLPVVVTDLPPAVAIGAGWTSRVEAGVRVMDYNLDGREDLLLVDNGVRPGASGMPATATRSHLVALISNGTGGVVAETLPIAIGDPADGYSSPPPLDNYHGYRTTQVLDANGDGLSDILLVRDGVLHLYLRRSVEPDVITRVVDGRGVATDFTFAPATDQSVVKAEAPECRGLSDLLCSPRGVWVAKEVSLTLGADVRRWEFEYNTPIEGRRGEGFFGFMSRSIHDTASTSRTDIEFHMPTRLIWPEHYVFSALGRKRVISTTLFEQRKLWITSTDYNFDPPDLRANETYAVSPADTRTNISQCNASCLNCTFNEGPIVCSETDGSRRTLSDRVTEFDFDSYGNSIREETTVRDGQGVLVQMSRRSTGFHPPNETAWLVSRVDHVTEVAQGASGGQTERTVGVDSNPTTGFVDGYVIQPDGDDEEYLAVSYSRNSLGQISSVSLSTRDGRVRTTGVTFDPVDSVLPATFTNAAGHVEQMWHHPGFGTLLRHRDANDRLTRLVVDTFGRDRGGMSLEDGFSDITYGGTSAKLEVTFVHGGVVRGVAEYDGLGRRVAMIKKTSTGDVRFETSYDLRGLVTDRRGPIAGGAVTNHETASFDGLTRPLSRCWDDDSAVDANGVPQHARPCEVYEYDYLNVDRLDAGNRLTRLVLDPLGRPMRTTRYDGGREVVTTRTYAAMGGLERIETVGQPAVFTRLEYDLLGRTTLIEQSGAGRRRLTYDGFGDLRADERLDAQGTLDPTKTVTFEYDQLGRTRFRRSPAGPSVAEFVWDEALVGALARTTSSDGVNTSYTYDERGLLQGERWTVGSDVFQFGRTYDALGRVDVLTYPAAATAAFSVRHEYDEITGELERVARVEGGREFWRAVKRNALGQVEEERQGGVLDTVRTYYPYSSRPWTVEFTGAAQYSESREYYQHGALKTRSRDGYRERFTYDGLDRLKEWYPNELAGSPKVTYGIDDFGNMKTRAVADETVTYNYSGNAKLESLGVVSNLGTRSEQYVQDPFGRITGMPQGTVAYNSFDLPVTFSGQNGSPSFSFKYDAFGLRVERRDLSTNGTVVSIGALYERREASGTFEHTYRIAAEDRVVAETVVTANSSSTSYLFHDAAGTVVGAVDQGGATARVPRMDPFGAAVVGAVAYLPGTPTAAGSPSSISRLGFTGHVHDPEMGLINMGARMYNPRLGRFLSVDPVIAAVQAEVPNPWAYGRNNPLRYFDPDGRRDCPESDSNCGDNGEKWIVEEAVEDAVNAVTCLLFDCKKAPKDPGGQGAPGGKVPPPPNTWKDQKPTGLGSWDNGMGQREPTVTTVTSSTAGESHVSGDGSRNTGTTGGTTRTGGRLEDRGGNGAYLGPPGGLWGDGANVNFGPGFHVPDTSSVWQTMGDIALLPVGGAEMIGMRAGAAAGAAARFRIARLANLPPGVLGATDKFGNIMLARGLSAAERTLTLRHELVHRFFSPTRPGLFQNFRATLGQAAYNRSHLLRFIEEGIAEGYATRSIMQGITFPFRGGYVTLPRLVLESAFLSGGVGYGGYRLGND